MSIGKEWFRFHLTPQGWEKGSHRLDGQVTTEKPVPAGTVLTLTRYEAVNPNHDFRIEKSWESEKLTDDATIERYQKEYGELPPEE